MGTRTRILGFGLTNAPSRNFVVSQASDASLAANSAMPMTPILNIAQCGAA